MEKWLKNFRKRYKGNLYIGKVDLENSIPIGSNLKRDKYEFFRNKTDIHKPYGINSDKPCGIIYTNGIKFIVDGRHRSRASLDKGIKEIDAKVFSCNSDSLEKSLLQNSWYLLDEIPIL